MTAYDGFEPYFGDLHSHCALSYGHGSVEDAFRNARLQLDFASVTAHAHWPDIPDGEGHLAAVRRYHQEGFERAATNWPVLQAVSEANNQDGDFVSFLSFEWHSLRYGDHNVYFKDGEGEIIRAPDLVSLRSRLRELRANGTDTLLIPHHIGYRRGYRGIDWTSFTDEFSPLVEIFSMHGSSESDEAPYPYLHTMGPRDTRSTMAHGLEMGHTFGVIGSTDHHSAHPGSYGHGRLGVWASELTRDGIWEALTARRTYALTGENLELKVSVNHSPMGAVAPYSPERAIDVDVVAGSAIDYIEVLEDNRAIHRWGAHQVPPADRSRPTKVLLELGWGEMEEDIDWQVELSVDRGALLDVQPRLRGRDIVSPQSTELESYAFSSWERVGENGISLTTRTWKNPSIVSPATQGICLEIHGDDGTRLVGTINGRRVDIGLDELRGGSHVEYLGGFLSPAYCFHQAIPETEYRVSTSTVHHVDHRNPSWYHVRVRQKNGQWAWSSPIWVSGA